jgi:hypothetical protein
MNEIPEDFVNAQYIGKIPGGMARYIFRIPENNVHLLLPSRRPYTSASGLSLKVPPTSILEFIVRSEIPTRLVVSTAGQSDMEVVTNNNIERIRLVMPHSGGDTVIYSDRQALISHFTVTDHKCCIFQQKTK